MEGGCFLNSLFFFACLFLGLIVFIVYFVAPLLDIFFNYLFVCLSKRKVKKLKLWNKLWYSRRG